MEPSVLGSFQFKLIVAFVVGSIIGLERQFAKERREDEVLGEGPGVRSFGLISLMGSAAAVLELDYGITYLVVISFLSILMIIGIFLYYNIATKKELSLTTSIAAILAYILGVFVGIGELYWAIVISVFITAILSIKHKILAFLKSLEYREITSALQIAILALLILPIVPPIIIMEAINLQVFVVFLVFVLLVEFMGYIAVRHLGERKGLIAFAWFGALVHSESTTMEITRMYNKLKPKLPSELISIAILIVDASLMLRSLLFISVLVYSSPLIIILFGLSILLSVVFCVGYAYRKFKRQPVVVFEKSKLLTSPLSYSSAVKFASILFILSVVIVFLRRLSIELVLFAAFLGGLFSVTGVELAIASMLLAGKLSLLEALLALNIAMCAGLSNKILYVKIAGGDRWLLLRVVLYTVAIIMMIIVSYFTILLFLPF